MDGKEDGLYGKMFNHIKMFVILLTKQKLDKKLKKLDLLERMNIMYTFNYRNKSTIKLKKKKLQKLLKTLKCSKYCGTKIQYHISTTDLNFSVHAC